MSPPSPGKRPAPAPVAGKPAPKLPPGPAPTDAAARIGKDVITVGDVDRRITADVAAAQVFGDPDERAYRLAELRLRVLEELIGERLLLAEADRRGLRASEADIDTAVDEIKKTNALDQAAFEKVLTDQGYTLARYRTDLGDQLARLRLIAMEEPQHDKRAEAAVRLVQQHRASAGVVVELKLPNKPASLRQRLDVAAMLDAADLAATLKRSLPPFTADRMTDQPSSARYDSWHFKANGKPESFDMAFRVWRGSAAEMQDKWDELRTSLPQPVKLDKRLADATLEAAQPGVLGIGFLDRRASVVVLVTCGTDLCKTADEVLALARLAHGRLDRIVVKD